MVWKSSFYTAGSDGFLDILGVGKSISLISPLGAGLAFGLISQ